MRANIKTFAIMAILLATIGFSGCRSTTLLSIPGVGQSSSAEEILTRIRSDHGMPALTADRTLERAAREQAELMAKAGRMEHTAVRGRDFLVRVRRAGIEGAAAENIARGRFTLDRLFLAWMNSAGHRRNMLDPRFSRYGLASAATGRGDERYWALIVAR